MIDETKNKSIKLNESRGHQDLKQKTMKQKKLNADLDYDGPEDNEATSLLSAPMKRAANTLKSSKADKSEFEFNYDNVEAFEKTHSDV